MKQVEHRGESPSKKKARLLLWRWVLKRLEQRLPKRPPESMNYLVIPSAAAGDLSVLTSLGVPAANIYAVDVDKHAIAEARRRFPKAKYLCGPFWEAEKRFPELRKNLGCAFIDLCGPINSDTFKEVLKLGDGSSLVAYEFLCGRERGETWASISEKEGDPILRRIQHLETIKLSRKRFQCEAVYHYKSHSAAHFGKHMVAVVGQTHTRRLRSMLEMHDVDTDWQNLRKEILALSTAKASGYYNVSPTSIAAWRAHETRGTYRF